MNCLISPHYIEQNSSLHETNEFYGTTSYRRVGDILSVANSISAKSILDYGCGKALLHSELLQRNNEFNQPCQFMNYDPAITEFSLAPTPADLVVCTDVMADLKRLTLHTLYLAISTRPSAKTLPDGRNTHLIVKPAAWWLPKLRKDFTPWRTNWNEKELVTVLRPR
jgi:hypothetical protein